MWYRDRVWIQYLRQIIAADMRSAVFLASYSRRLALTKDYAAALEVVDLQRYKVISDTKKVRHALRDRAHVPFIFVVCKN